MVYQNATAAPREELTDVIMEGVTNDFSEFQGLAVLPPVPMKLPTGHVPKVTIAKGDVGRATSRVRTPGTNFTRWQSTIEDYSITLAQVAEEIQLPDEQTLLYEDYLSFEEMYATEATNRLRRGHELEASTAVQSTSNFAATASSVAWTVANQATMKPVTDILDALRRVKAKMEKADTVIMSGTVWDVVRLATQTASFVAGTVNPGAIVTPNTLQTALAGHGVKQVLIGDGYVNQSESLTNNSINPIWNNTYCFVGAAAGGALRAGGIGRTFYWEAEGPLFNISSYRDEPKKSNIIRAQKTTLTAITNTRAGTLITTQYA